MLVTKGKNANVFCNANANKSSKWESKQQNLIENADWSNWQCENIKIHTNFVLIGNKVVNLIIIFQEFFSALLFKSSIRRCHFPKLKVAISYKEDKKYNVSVTIKFIFRITKKQQQHIWCTICRCTLLFFFLSVSL